MSDPTPANPPNPIDPGLFRAVMGHFATGVTIVTYLRDGTPAGMTANAFLSASMQPPLVLVSVRNDSQFNQHMTLGKLYGINLLTEQQQLLSAHFGGRHINGLHVPFERTQDVPLIDGSLAHVVARVVDIHPAGDHLLYIGHVEHLRRNTEAPPLIFYSGAYTQIHTYNPVQWGATEGW